ncbi:MAG: HD domain-containing phosphohydrolase, partial [Chloroflexota bacterium]
ACDSHGYTKDEFMNMSMRELSLSPPELAEARRNQLAEKGEATFEGVHLCKDGSVIPVERHSNVIKLGNKRYILTVAHDTTERKKTEEEIKQSLARLQRAIEQAINTMALITELRDPYTAGHQHRVSQLSLAIAQEMNLPDYQVEGIRIASLVHDIGKMHVPAEILSKPGKLTALEFEMIKAHCQVGYDILKTIDFPWPIAQIVLQHHERINGSGYPAGLTGEKALLEAKIMAVADVVEAMSSHRPYRPALGADKALEEIEKNKGILYDPDVVDTCVRLFAEKGFRLD